MQVLILENQFKNEEASTTAALDRLKRELKSRNVRVVESYTVADAGAVIRSNLPVDCMLLTKTLTKEAESAAASDAQLSALIERLHDRQPNVPIFLLTDRGVINDALDLQLAKRIDEFVWIFEDSAEFVTGRVLFAIGQYTRQLLPPLTAALRDYYGTFEYSWDVPGHQGGVGFRKTPAGRAFHDFYGEKLFNTDINRLSLSLGSLLGHSGAFQQSEQNIARIFGAHLSFSGVVGTSGSNRSVMQFCVPEGATVAIDRNCHKSIAQGLVLTAAKPVYMVPSRNRYGIIGPVSVDRIRKAVAHGPVYGVVTNCTYDGICYNSVTLEHEMRNVRYVHLDEAWFAYARFHPLYRNMHAMRGDASQAKNSSAVFATHSSHKMLNALTMASYIHVRNGSRVYVDATKFNDFYMMHTTTSPSTIVAASNDIAAHMMDGQTGLSLTHEVILEAVAFRQTLARLWAHYAAADDWFFKPWNIEQFDGVPFEKLSCEQLATDQKYWMLRPGDQWHGYDELTDVDYAMIDPIKVSILTPGMNADGSLAKNGVPAQLVHAWLVRKGIIPARHTDFQVMFLFAMGVTKGKWATLLQTLYSFKNHYDANSPVRQVLPEVAQGTDKYDDLGLGTLGDQMFNFLRQTDLPALLNKAFETLPAAAMTPRQGNQKLITNSERVKLRDLPNRVVATSILPYPPGIPMLISGERFGQSVETCPYIRYLLALEEWDKRFPGFGHETTGVEIDADGNYQILCAVDPN